MSSPRYGGRVAARNPYFAPPAIQYGADQGRRRATLTEATLVRARNPFYAPPAIDYVSGGVPRDAYLAVGGGAVPIPAYGNDGMGHMGPRGPVIRPFIPDAPPSAGAVPFHPLASPFHNDGFDVKAGDTVAVPDRRGGYEEGKVLALRGGLAIVLVDRPRGTFRLKVPRALLEYLDDVYDAVTVYPGAREIERWTRTGRANPPQGAVQTYLTTVDKDHDHVAFVNELGSGFTTSDNDHRHMIEGGKVLEAKGHTHNLVKGFTHRAMNPGLPYAETLQDLYQEGMPNPPVVFANPSAYSKSARDYLSQKIPLLMREGKSQQQAVAIAMSMARKRGLKVPAERKKKRKAKPNPKTAKRKPVRQAKKKAPKKKAPKKKAAKKKAVRRRRSSR